MILAIVSRYGWLAILLVLATLVGCGRGNSLANSAKIQGQITVDGQPVEQGALQFMPLDQGPATGAQIEAGRYEVQVPRGKLRVMVTATRATGKMIQEYSSTVPEVVSLVPAKYRQGIEIEVSGDNAQQNFHLTSK